MAGGEARPGPSTVPSLGRLWMMGGSPESGGVASAPGVCKVETDHGSGVGVGGRGPLPPGKHSAPAPRDLSALGGQPRSPGSCHFQDPFVPFVPGQLSIWSPAQWGVCGPEMLQEGSWGGGRWTGGGTAGWPHGWVARGRDRGGAETRVPWVSSLRGSLCELAGEWGERCPSSRKPSGLQPGPAPSPHSRFALVL